jgi:glycosyltransferase involved in cell wall biosynthesis
MPRFSIIIPTYNRLPYLKKTLNSIWEQSFTDFEIIVVDDGSTDGTVNYLRELGGGCVELFRQDNRGPGAARNLGVEHARGEYTAFLDSDDVWFPWTLKTYAAIVEKTGSPAFISGNHFRFTNEAAIEKVDESPLEFNLFRDYLTSGDEWRWWGVSSFIIKTELVKSCGGFTENNVNCEDADIALKLGEAPVFVQITSPYTFAYREHLSNVTKNFTKTLNGAWLNVNSERSSSYPGGPGRSHERWRILTRHLRPVTVECLKIDRKREAWKLYCATFRWHLALGRWKYLIAFPILTLAAFMRGNNPG